MPEQPDYENAFKTWKSAPVTPESNASILRTLDPVIDSATVTHVGKVNPLIKGKARSMTLQALQTYKPERGKLSSHIYSQLQGLKRFMLKLPAACTCRRESAWTDALLACPSRH